MLATFSPFYLLTLWSECDSHELSSVKINKQISKSTVQVRHEAVRGGVFAPQAWCLAPFSLPLPYFTPAPYAGQIEQQVMLPSAWGTAQERKILKLQGTPGQHKTKPRFSWESYWRDGESQWEGHAHCFDSRKVNNLFGSVHDADMGIRSLLHAA